MKSSLRAALPWAVIVLAALGAALLRYQFIEPSSMQHACEGDSRLWWCGTRDLVVQGFLSYGYGYAAIIAALLAVAWRSVGIATLAACIGVLALQLYCYEGGALALLIGVLRLVRIQSDRQQVALAAA
ncbi:MAG TPA: hypothetical protein VGN46_19575 [Luteibacter sp.]|jgi:hypothetical protein|uniref:hypothetical protein n=1 Tax=Luteibacter sp. TaxID=1886636 RepID=UPI002F3EFA20